MKALIQSSTHLVSGVVAVNIFALARCLLRARRYYHHLPQGPLCYWQTKPHRNKPVVVFLHGFGDSQHGIYPWAFHMARYYQLIVPDLPAFGASFRDPSLRYDADSYVAWLGQWLDELDCGPVHLIGNSMGGGLALAMAVERPDLVRSLAVLNAGGVVLPGQHSLYQEILAGQNIFDIKNREDFHRLVTRVFYRRAKIPWAIREQVYRNYLDNRQWHAYVLGQLFEGIENIHDPRVAETALNQRLAEIRCPGLVLWGQQDSFFPVETAYYIAERLAHGSVHVFEGVGHTPQVEVPGAVAKVYRDFLQQNFA